MRYSNHLMVAKTDRNGQTFYWEYDGPATGARCIHTWGDGGILEGWIEYGKGKNTVTNSLGHKTIYYYDENNLCTQVTDPDGNHTFHEYTEYMEPYRNIDQEGNITGYTYDDRSNLTGIVQPDGSTVTRIYNEDDRIILSISPGGASTVRVYNDRGLNYDQLKSSYEILKKSDNPYNSIFDFKEELLSSDNENSLEFHYTIIQDKTLSEKLRSTIKTFFYADTTNVRTKDKVADFLYNKYETGIKNTELRADVIQLLGNLRSRHAKPVAIENINLEEKILRYRSIIVLGWVGDKADLEILNERLVNDPDPQLRGYAATAMRQIWFNHPKTKDTILNYFKSAIEKEEEEKALEGIIISTQDLLKKKLGLKESTYGDISGDLTTAKVKTLSALK